MKTAATKKVTAKTTTTKGAAKAKPVAKPKEPTLKEMITTARAGIAADEAELSKLKDQVKALETKIAEEQRAKNFLYKIYSMSNWSEKPYEWNCRKWEGTTYGNTAWEEFYTFRAAKLELKVAIKERKDLKKMKWEVTVSGEELRIAKGDYSGYKLGDHIGDDWRDTSYLKKKYMDYHYDNDTRSWVCLPDPKQDNLVLEMKFDNEAKARTWAKCWMNKLAEDHKDVIEYEKSLMKQSAAVKKIQEAEEAARVAAHAASVAAHAASVERTASYKAALKARAEARKAAANA